MYNSMYTVSKHRCVGIVLVLSTGNRGIKALFVQDELLRSCLALSHSTSVAITTGFPTHYMHRYLHLIIAMSLSLSLSLSVFQNLSNVTVSISAHF